MGRRGPKPKPRALVQGWRSKLPNTEPPVIIGAPDTPPDLKDRARDIWDALVNVVPPGVLSKDNGNLLYRYCKILVMWEDCDAWLSENPHVIEVSDRAGNVRCVIHPYAKLHTEYSKQLLKIEQEIGMTPSARTRIQVTAQEQKKTPQRDFPDEPVLRIAE